MNTESKRLRSISNLKEETLHKYLDGVYQGIYSKKDLSGLIESAYLLFKAADDVCAGKDVGGMEEWAKENKTDAESSFDCGWYHGTWQILRLLNMVAVPRWYKFYEAALSRVLRTKPNANIFICAAADYGMLATLHDAIENTKSNPKITLYDICRTPLESTQWFAERHNAQLVYKSSNIITDEVKEGPFDLIVTDEFLTVLQDAYKPQIAKRWQELLVLGGYLVTTCMEGVPTTPEVRKTYSEKAISRFREYREDIFFNFSDDEAKDVEAALQKFADYHTRHMVADEGSLKNLLSDFSELSLEQTWTPGECVSPTYSYQIVAKR